MKCQKCQRETFMPFQCSYCRGSFCSEHRMPENHACPRIDFARSQPNGNTYTPGTGNQSSSSYHYSVSYGQASAGKRNGHVYFGIKEVRHILIAAVLVLSIGYSIWLYNWAFGGLQLDLPAMSVFAGLIAASFLIHEIAHKITAQRSGLWAEFRLTSWGVMLTFVSIFLPFKMISPGAMMLSGNPNSFALLKIALSGPVTNLLFSGGFIASAIVLMNYNSLFCWAFFMAAYINAFIALFNLIFFGMLDGYKIFRWNKKIWAVAFIAALALTIAIFVIIMPI